jgi:hypothetical protein
MVGMSKLATLLVVVVALVVGGSTAASAQCLTFSPALPCAKTAPSPFRLDGSARKAPVPKPTQIEPASPSVRHEAQGIDCQMIRTVDPKLRSAMPVITPDPKVELPAVVVQVPPCSPPKK